MIFFWAACLLTVEERCILILLKIEHLMRERKCFMPYFMPYNNARVINQVSYWLSGVAEVNLKKTAQNPITALHAVKICQHNSFQQRMFTSSAQLLSKRYSLLSLNRACRNVLTYLLKQYFCSKPLTQSNS
jgi:hypothetical protein